jgi:hypothetical protein
MKTAQDYLSLDSGGECFGGFNSRLYGESWSKAVSGSPQGSVWAQRNAGWNLADSMIKSGKIYSKTTVKDKEITFKCFADGDEFCCVGEGFENLQESNNYAFGDCFDSAVVNFGLLNA